MDTASNAIYSTLAAANRFRDAEWNLNQNIDASFRGNELAGEVGEACNIVKKLERHRLGLKGGKQATRENLEDLNRELADVVICAYLLAMHYNLNLDECIEYKFNATSEKHGLKTRLVLP